MDRQTDRQMDRQTDRWIDTEYILISVERLEKLVEINLRHNELREFPIIKEGTPLKVIIHILVIHYFKVIIILVFATRSQSDFSTARGQTTSCDITDNIRTTRE